MSRYRKTESQEIDRPVPQEFTRNEVETMTTTYQTPESKKEEFRRYLEKSGVIDAFTKVLVGLYEEPDRPPNAIEYVKKYLGAPLGVDSDAIRSENEEVKKQVKELKRVVEELTKSLKENKGLS